MVFPSPACSTCKLRRIKCDLSRPDCGRCVKAGRNCLWGSNDKAKLLFKNENDFAHGQQRRPRKRLIEEIPIQNQSVTLPSHLWPSLEARAFNYWLANFTGWPGDLRDVEHEYGSLALQYLGSTSSSSALHLSLSAFSLAIFGRAMMSDGALDAAREFYARSIRSMRSELQELSSQMLDQLLVVTTLLATYDNIMYPTHGQYNHCLLRPSNPEPKGCQSTPNIGHSRGAAGLLQVRRRQGWKQNSVLESVIRRTIVRSCILQGVMVPEWLEEGKLLNENEPMLVLDSLFVRVSNLRSEIVRFLQVGDSTSWFQRELESLLCKAKDLDRSLAMWVGAIPDSWGFSVVRSLSDDASHHFGGFTHTYSSHYHAAAWNRYRATRLIVGSLQMRLLLMLARFPFVEMLINLDITAHQSAFLSVATELCQGISFFFNAHIDPFLESHSPSIEVSISPMTATLVAWPLSVAVSAGSDHYTRSDQILWLCSRLDSVSRALGANLLVSNVDHGSRKDLMSIRMQKE